MGVQLKARWKKMNITAIYSWKLHGIAGGAFFRKEMRV